MNKVAVITGGDSGIGRAVAYAFSKEGADIVKFMQPISVLRKTASLLFNVLFTVSADWIYL